MSTESNTQPTVDSRVDDDKSNKKSKKRKRGDSVHYHCDYCRKDISNVVRIKCGVCQDFDLCLECFSVGVEIGAHKRDHDYHVMDTLNFPLFVPEWGADEELLLLEGIDMYGLGNWEDIADHIGTQSPESCKDHYFLTYIDLPTFPLPDTTRILTNADNLQKQRNNRQALLHAQEEAGADDDDKPKKVKDEKPKMDMPNAQFSKPELAGWMPMRKDFETQYDNDAELPLADLAFYEDDTPEEVQIKLKAIEAYNTVLDERARRIKFILENNLLEYKQQEKKRNKEEKELYDRHRIYARLLTAGEHEELLKSLIVERRLRSRIEELKEYRRLGISQLKDIEQYHTLKRMRTGGSAADWRKKPDISSSFPPSLSELGRSSSSMSTSSIGVSSPASPAMNNSAAANAMVLATLSTTLQVQKGRVGGGRPLDITGASGHEMLSEKERDLCAFVRLWPQQYLLIKDTLIRESMKYGNCLKKQMARTLIKIDVNKTGKVFDFLEENGFINRPFSTSHAPMILMPVAQHGREGFAMSN